MRAEHAWWLGLIAWGALVLFWKPDPPISYLEVPSANTRPHGYAIFHDMLEKNVMEVRLSLTSAAQLPDDTKVLILLSPDTEVPVKDREEMLDWVSSGGGTLIIGHPIMGEDGGILQEFVPDSTWALGKWTAYDELAASQVSYVTSSVTDPRQVPPFPHEMNGEISMEDRDVEAIALGDEGQIFVSKEPYGSGEVIQLASADLLGNVALGTKSSHLFAAALVDEVGRGKIWTFDESHEGIEPEPSLIALLGSGDYRPVFLQVLLVCFLLYWWRSSRVGAPRSAPPRRDVREVTSLSRDIGNFYFRSGKSQWALSRSLEYFKSALKRGKGFDAALREKAQKLVETSTMALSGETGVENHAALMQRMARYQRMLAKSSKGKKK